MNLSVIKKGMLMRPISRASQFVHSQSKALAAVAGGLPLTFYARHTAFVLRLLSSLRAYEISAAVIDPHAAIRVMREVLYREMAGSEWKPVLPGDQVMARLPEEDVKRPNKETLLWPAIRDQLFYAEANADGGQRVGMAITTTPA